MSQDEKDDVQGGDEREAQPLRIDEVADVAQGRRSRKSGEPDDDEETWTNQPASSDQDLGDVDDVEEDDEEEVAEAQRAPRKVIKTGRDVVCDELPDRAERAKLRMRPYVSGALVFELTNSGERFLFDWREELPRVTAIAKEASISCDEAEGLVVSAERLNVDAIISVSEQHLMLIRSGDLNPQVGMLTDKIKIRGKVSPCVYIFNLIAPRVRS